jgi:hypothetical protein
MTGKMKVIIGVLLTILLIIALVNSNKTEAINWSESYHLRDKIPFGLYVFDQEKHQFFDHKKENVLKIIEQSPYEYFHPANNAYSDAYGEPQEVVEVYDDETYDDETYDDEYDEANDSINIIATDSVAPTFDYYDHEHLLYIRNKQEHDTESIQSILKYVKSGAVAFLSASDFNKTLLDSLKVDMIYEFTPETDFVFGFYDKILKQSTCKYNKGTYGHYFSKIDSTTSKALGYQLKNKQKKTNFIVVNYGKGQIYLHSQPVVFTNYYMLKSTNYSYLSNLFKTIPLYDWVWFVQNQEIISMQSISDNKLRFISEHPPLKWAYWLLWLALLLFLIFNSKRKQRIIPVIKPLENTTIDFTKTIANLYFQDKNYKIIIRKKIIYFLEKVRTNYYLDTSKLDEDFAIKLAHKSGKNEDDIKKLVELIVHLKNRGFFTEIDLTQLNDALEQNNF